MRNSFFAVEVDKFFEQSNVFYKFGNETITPAYALVNAGIGTEIWSKNKSLLSIYFSINNMSDVAYQSNMSRLKYTDINNATGRIGVYNMGRNFSIKLFIPIDIK